MGRARISICQRNDEAMERSVKAPTSDDQPKAPEAPPSASEPTGQAPDEKRITITDESMGERAAAAPEQAEAPVEPAKKTRVLSPNTMPQTVPDGYAHPGAVPQQGHAAGREGRLRHRSPSPARRTVQLRRMDRSSNRQPCHPIPRHARHAG